MTANNSPNSLLDPAVSRVLAGLYEASLEDSKIVGRALASVAGRPDAPTLAESVDLCAEALLPVQPTVGKLLYLLVRSLRPTTVVEFGTSYGISMIHLAAGLRDNGCGRVIGTELSGHKVRQARKNLAEVGLADITEIREGDARETLADLPGPIDLVLLDGWKDLCLPVLELLEPRMRPGTVVIADNLPMMPQEYLDRVRVGDTYISMDLAIGEGIEISTRITPGPCAPGR